MASSSVYFDKVSKVDAGVRVLTELREKLDTDPTIDVKAMLDKSLELMARKAEYCNKMSTEDSLHAATIYKTTMETPWNKLFEDGKVREPFTRIWMSGREIAQVLQFICRMQKVKDFLEVGMFTGYVSMVVAEALPDNGRVVTCEMDQYLMEHARTTFDATPYGKKIEIRQGDARKTLKTLAAEGRTFDLTYVDADEVDYLTYFKTLLDLGLLAPGGTLAVDNTFHFGQVLTNREDSVIDVFNQAVLDDERVDQVYTQFAIVTKNVS